ncbi:MAG: hypothetical protein JW889_14145 [Verrucomicrobia bacterium]|nr:hypothetical protein [Verrucomicrobiota bacterium]
MRTAAILALTASAALWAGCATLDYPGMPGKDEPHALAVEDAGVDFIEIDGLPVNRPAFSMPKLRLTPGQHTIVARYNYDRSDLDYVGDLELETTVHYWSRYAHGLAFHAQEGYRYEVGAVATLPSTTITYDYERDGAPPDYDSGREGRVHVDVDHELVNPDDWRPVIVRTLPIKDYWRGRPLPVAEIRRDTATPNTSTGAGQ